MTERPDPPRVRLFQYCAFARAAFRATDYEGLKERLNDPDTDPADIRCEVVIGGVACGRSARVLEGMQPGLDPEQYVVLTMPDGEVVTSCPAFPQGAEGS